MSARSRLIVLVGSIIWCFPGVVSQAVELEPSFFERDIQRVRFASATLALTTSDPAPAMLTADEGGEDGGDRRVGRKSPFKAFLLSAALPGAGQFYCGSRIKPLFFLGAEIAAWGLHFKYQGQGDDRTDEFEQFNRDHWSREDYEQKYLLWAYNSTDDELIHEREVSHHLPDTRTQQYYEMTGKYNQFAWGWDDAEYNGNRLGIEYDSSAPPPRIKADSLTPNSARRMIYEGMRYEANRKYDQARKMIIVSILNRLVSSFEALLAARRHNQNVAGDGSVFTGINVRASLKSYHTRRDTPFVKLAYKF